MRRALAVLALLSATQAFGASETECQQSQIVASYVRAVSSRAWLGELERLATGGDRSAQVALGQALGYQGLPWLERAAAEGSLFAVKLLHAHFASNAVLSKDSEERTGFEQHAARWAHAGAKLNDLDMQRALGDYFSEGKGIARDDGAAVRWWRAAAENGSSFAQNSLSKALFEGRGAKRDSVEALKWAMLAAQKINGPSFGRLQVFHLSGLRSGMSDAEIALAEENARVWSSQYKQREHAKHDANERECGIREFDKGVVR